MDELKQFYDSIQYLKNHELNIDKEETNKIEEKIIQGEIIPALSKAIEPIVYQMKSEFIFVIHYDPEKPISITMTRKGDLITRDEEKHITETKHIEPNEKIEFSDTQKSDSSNIIVIFPDGIKISNKNASQTFCEVIEKIGPEKVAKLGIKKRDFLVSKQKSEKYEKQQHEIADGWLVLTVSDNTEKKRYIEEISKQLNLNLKVIKN